MYPDLTMFKYLYLKTTQTTIQTIVSDDKEMMNTEIKQSNLPWWLQ